MTFSRHRRLAVAASILVAGALALSACSSSTPAPPKASGSLTIWAEDYYVAIFKPLVNTWAKKTGIQVKFVTKDFNQMGDQFIAAVPAGEGPDIFISPSTTAKFVNDGVVAPVQLGSGSQFVPSALGAFTNSGQVYGVPFDVENVALYRNTALAPEKPKTFDDAVSAGKKLVAAGKAKTAFAIGLDPTAGNPYLMMSLQTSFGSTLFGKTSGEDNPKDLTIDDAAGQKFAQALAGWGSSGALDPDLTGDIALQQFKDGQTPFFVSGPWDLDGIKTSGVKFAIDPLPTAGDQPARPFAGYYGVYESSKAKNALAANLFLTDFMTQKTTQVGIWKKGQNPPALISASNAVSSDPNTKAFATIGKTAVGVPEISAMDQVWGPWGQTEMQILRGQAPDPAAAWTAMGDKIRAAIAAG